MVNIKYILGILLFLYSSISVRGQFNKLDSCVYLIKEIEEKSSDFNELQFLNEKLKGINVVFLGEGQHDLKVDGVVQNHLIKYLHEKQGFNVVLVERNFYDLWRLNATLQKSENIDDSLAKYLDAELDVSDYDVIKYVHQQKGNNIDFTIGGLDIFSTCATQTLCPFSFLKDNSSLLANNEHIEFLKAQINNGLADKGKLDLAFDYLQKQTISRSFFVNDSLNDLWYQIYKNIMVNYYYAQHPLKKGEKESGAYYAYRDSIMADNFKFYRDRYKNAKFIVVASTYHITKGQQDFSYLSDNIFGKNVKTMGQYIAEDSSNHIYSIINLFNEGYVKKKYILRNGSNVLPKRSKKSIEYKMNERGYKSAFIDFHKLSATGDTSFLMYPLYIEKLEANWDEIYDGAIYMEKSEPSEVREFYNVIFKDGKWIIRWE